MDHPEEVVGVPFPASDEAAVVVEPGEEPFDFPPAPAAAERPAILRRDLRVRRCRAISSIP